MMQTDRDSSRPGSSDGLSTGDRASHRASHPEGEEVARTAGIAFSDPTLLRRALTHRSYINEHPNAVEDNERLEFLGDACLDMTSAAYLFQRFRSWTRAS
jgi:dsRNA-specific ribonuclease